MSTYPPDGYYINTWDGVVWGTDIDVDTGVFLTGDSSVKFKNTSVTGNPDRKIQADLTPCEEGQPLLVEAWVRADSKTAGNEIHTYVVYADNTKTYLSSTALTQAVVGTVDTWEMRSGIDTAPAGACWAQPMVLKTYPAFNAYVDSIVMRKFPKSFRAHLGSTQQIDADTGTKVEFAHEDFDYGGIYDNATNFRFTAPETGVYSISTYIQEVTTVSDTWATWYLYLMKGGGSYVTLDKKHVGGGSSYNVLGGSCTEYLTAGEYLEIYTFHGDAIHWHLDGSYSLFSAFRIG